MTGAEKRPMRAEHLRRAQVRAEAQAWAASAGVRVSPADLDALVACLMPRLRGVRIPVRGAGLTPKGGATPEAARALAARLELDWPKGGRR